jgi:hypothetical protein
MVPVETLQTPGARHLLGTWRRQRIDHLVPSERTMAPSSFGGLAGNLYRLDIDPLSERMRFGFVGAAVRRWLGEDLPGRFLDEAGILPDRAQHDEDCRLALREARPIGALVQGSMTDDGRPVTRELLILPLTHGMRAADGVICGVFEIEDETADPPAAPPRESRAGRA